MKHDVIARRIKEARERCSLSQSELAALMGWKSHGTLVAIENGKQAVKAWELLKFANILKVLPESLYNENADIPKLPIILWRNRALDPASLSEEERSVIQHYEDYRLIKRLIGDTWTLKQLPRETCDINTADTSWANHLAERMHRDLNLGDYPASLLAQRLEDDYGVLIMNGHFSNGSAACCRSDSDAAIVLNEKEVPWRQMFDLAHELFHLITWDSILIESIHANEKLFSKNEKLADAFAAALLMPQQMIGLDLQGNRLTYSLVVALARKYRVSTAALLWRLCYLRIIPRNTVELILKDEDFKKLDKSSFKHAFASVQPFDNRFLRLAYLAHEQGRLSKARLAQMLNVKLRDLDRHLSEKGLYLTNDKEIEANID